MAAAIEQPRNLVNTPEDVSSINKYVKNLGLSQALGEAGLPINATEIETAKFQSNFESLLADQRLNEYARGTITRPLLVAGLNANQTQAKMAEIKSYDLIDERLYKILHFVLHKNYPAEVKLDQNGFRPTTQKLFRFIQEKFGQNNDASGVNRQKINDRWNNTGKGEEFFQNLENYP
jgi:hypothetical protein